VPLVLWDVDDAARFCSAIVTRSGLALSHHDREDLQQHLFIQIWELSLRYDSGDPKFPPRFSVYATNLLRLRIVDWQRAKLGRSRWTFHDRVYERERPQLVSLDVNDAGDDGVESALAGSGLDRGERELADELRLLRKRSRPPAGYFAEVHRELSRRTA
jgi:hypothetical protein